MKGPLYALIVLGLVGYCFGGTNRQCYSCTYNSYGTFDVSCEEPCKSATKATCSGECKKTYTESSGYVSVTRSCAPFCIAVDCVEESGGQVCITCCDSDLCNGASSVTFTLVAMFSLIITAWGLSK